MPQVKIHVSSTTKEEIKEKLAIEVRKLVFKGLGLNDDKGQVMVYEAEYRGIHYSRDREFVFIECFVYTGTAAELKESLAKSIIDKVQEISEIDRKEINILFIEAPRGNFFYGERI